MGKDANVVAKDTGKKLTVLKADDKKTIGPDNVKQGFLKKLSTSSAAAAFQMFAFLVSQCMPTLTIFAFW